jgi:hypothetical protein
MRVLGPRRVSTSCMRPIAKIRSPRMASASARGGGRKGFQSSEPLSSPRQGLIAVGLTRTPLSPPDLATGRRGLRTNSDRYMPPLIFRCPTTGYDVQHWTDDDEDAPQTENEGLVCPICTRLHFVNKLLQSPIPGHLAELGKRRSNPLRLGPLRFTSESTSTHFYTFQVGPQT